MTELKKILECNLLFQSIFKSKEFHMNKNIFLLVILVPIWVTASGQRQDRYLIKRVHELSSRIDHLLEKRNCITPKDIRGVRKGFKRFYQIALSEKNCSAYKKALATEQKFNNFIEN